MLEFGFTYQAWVGPGDTLVALDPGRRRLVVFDSAGTLVRGESFQSALQIEMPALTGEPICRGPVLQGVLAGGARVVSDWMCLMLQGSSGERRWPVRYLLVEGAATDTLFFTEGPRVRERGGVSDPNRQYTFLPLQASPRIGVAEDRVFVSDGVAHEVRVYDSTGALVERWREATDPAAVTSSVRERYLAEREARDRPHPEDVPFPERVGAYSELVVARDGTVWLRRSPLPGREGRRWVLFSPDGRELRRLVLPDFTLTSVRGGRAYGHRTDALGVQRVIVFDVPGPK